MPEGKSFSAPEGLLVVVAIAVVAVVVVGTMGTVAPATTLTQELMIDAVLQGAESKQSAAKRQKEYSMPTRSPATLNIAANIDRIGFASLDLGRNLARRVFKGFGSDVAAPGRTGDDTAASTTQFQPKIKKRHTNKYKVPLIVGKRKHSLARTAMAVETGPLQPVPVNDAAKE